MLILLIALLCILSGGGVYIFLQKKISVLNSKIQVLEKEKQELENNYRDIKLENQNIEEQRKRIENEKQQLEIELSKAHGELKILKDNQQRQEDFFKEQQERQQKWIEQQQENQTNIFQNLSNKTLEEQTEIGKKKFDDILKPLKDKIVEYQQEINKVNTQTKTEIKTKIDEMLKQTLDIGGKADRLANAFEGDKKGQGNFGELKFEELLNWYGFNEGENYYKQYLVKTEEQKNKYPDFILQAQPNKWLVIDSKFSVVSYTKYINEQDIVLKQKYLAEYVNNLKDRIKELGEKEYHKLLKQNGKETFDFVCLFFGNEMAYLTAISNIQYRQEIEDLSRKYKVAVLTASAFSPILQMIQQLWSIGKTNENIIKAREMIEKWLTKIADFGENMTKIGSQIDNVKKTYNDAVIQLSGKGSAMSIAKDVQELVDAKLKPKNGKEREIKEPILLSNTNDTENN